MVRALWFWASTGPQTVRSTPGLPQTSAPCSDSGGREYGRDHHRDNQERYIERRRTYYEANRERIRQYYASKHRSRKVRVLLAYGGVCVCCGERNLGLLTLDHRNGDGAEHRKALGHGKTSSRIYAWAEENGFPDVLQVMCWNCNSGRYHNGGVCPHKDEEWVSISEAGTDAA
jgi:hypothetical protein